jgi:hypothetical protein
MSDPSADDDAPAFSAKYYSRFLLIVLIASATVFLFWLLNLLLVFSFESLESSGNFGDSFGVVNALFTGFSLTFIGAALFLQRTEVAASLKELRTTAIAQTEQVVLNERVRKESTEALARLFNSKEFQAARNEAWKTRRKFFSDEALRVKYAGIYIDIDEDYGDELQDEISGYATSLIIDYYTSLYHHCAALRADDQLDIAAVLSRRYLWPYWRGYLLCLGREVENLYISRVLENPTIDAEQFPLPAWIEELRTFDIMSGLPPYEMRTNPWDHKYFRA